MNQVLKKCTMCHLEKNLSEFHFHAVKKGNPKQYPMSRCKPCHAVKNREWKLRTGYKTSNRSKYARNTRSFYVPGVRRVYPKPIEFIPELVKEPTSKIVLAYQAFKQKKYAERT